MSNPKDASIPIPERGTPYVPREHWPVAEERALQPLSTPFDLSPMSILPKLTTDQKVELRTVAPKVLAGARSAVDTIATIANMQPRGVFEACALSACSSFASLASGLALLGAAVALAVCNDGEEPNDEAKERAARADAADAIAFRDRWFEAEKKASMKAEGSK